MVPLHVEQRHLAHDGAPQVGAASREHVPYEQPAVRAAHAREGRRGAQAARDEVGPDGLEQGEGRREAAGARGRALPRKRTSISSYTLWRFSRSPAWCHAGPNSPPPRMLASA